MSKSVFISSTSVDLKSHRAAVDSAIRRLQLRPINMDDFGSQPGGAGGVSIREVRQADIFIGIVAHRYGSIPAGQTRSVTEQEYDEAVRLNIPRLMYLLDPAADWPSEHVETTAEDKLSAFRAKIEKTDVRSLFTTPDALAAQVTADLANLIEKRRRESPIKRGLGVVILAIVLTALLLVGDSGLRTSLLIGLNIMTLTATPSSISSLTMTPLSTVTSFSSPTTTVTYAVDLSVTPKNAYEYVNQGVALYNQNKLDEAIADYIEAIHLNPKYTIAYYNLGIAYGAQGKIDEAITQYTHAIDLNPQYASAYYNRGVTQSSRGMLDEALSDYSNAIQINPQLSYVYHARGNVYYEQGKLDKAIDDFTKVIDLKPDDGNSYWTLGNLYYDFGHYIEALANYQKYIELVNNNPDPLIVERVKEVENILKTATPAISTTPTP